MLNKYDDSRKRSDVTTKLINRMPKITIFFWLIKIMATTVGETAADFLSFNLHLGLTNTAYVMGCLLIVALFTQFKLKRYVPAIYWLIVVLASVTGTLITDNLVDNFSVSLQTTTILFATALFAVFVIWHASEKALSMHCINTDKREIFYWPAILITFALGTSTGDLFAEYYRMGYAFSALIFLLAIAVIAIAYYRFRVNGVFTFWMSYILTRPLGASIGDLLSQPTHLGGLGLGTLLISEIFLSLIAIQIAVMTIQQKKQASN